jgi:monoamine oxidase
MTAAALRFAPVYARSHLRNCLGLGDNLSMGLVFDRLLSRSRNRTDQRLLLWLLSMVEAMDAATAYDLSLAQWNFIDYCQTSFYPEESFEGLVCDAAKGLDIRFSTEVSRLVYNDHNVTALTSKGSFSADMALVTVPLGVLKSGIPVFDPPLEMKKRKAIEGIGYGGQGVLNKIALEFPERFWPRGCEKLGSLPLDAADRGVFNIWIDHERSAGAPLLVGFTNGAASAEMDRQCADEEILSKALQVLQRMFSREIPEPEAFRVTRWLSDPWALGSYSYASVGTKEEHRRTLTAPVENRLYFAGEAAHKTHYGTVHGALLSGEREALRIHRLNCCGFTEQRHLPWH